MAPSRMMAALFVFEKPESCSTTEEGDEESIPRAAAIEVEEGFGKEDERKLADANEEAEGCEVASGAWEWNRRILLMSGAV